MRASDAARHNPTMTLSSTHCPLPDAGGTDCITLAHGEGGRLMRQLIEQRIMPTIANEYLKMAGDAAILPVCSGKLAMTTDSFVVSPLFFPGGDIGSLAVYGTVNDLAVVGAEPRWISLALILEEGLPLGVLQQVLESIAAAAESVGVLVVTGDTKVVPNGAVDKLFINTTGVGEFSAPPFPGPVSLEVGNELIVTGPIGQHGMAVMVSRDELALDPPPQSDSGPLVDAVRALRRTGVPVTALRDATRGGLAAVLHEWSGASGTTLMMDESCLPVTAPVRGACELLGIDPVHVANEGTMVVAVPQGQSAAAIAALRTVAQTAGAVAIGEVIARGIAPVIVRRVTGSLVPLDEPVGAQLPRIC